ncbi:MAG: hypothetical protein GEV08_15980, partial [Acidimicrobiia bacterium]|nr:hypothetical protein [Acidimicrobiia bacterium]
MAAIAGPDIVAAGNRAVDVARDDVVLVAGPAGPAAVLTEIGSGLCATNVQVNAIDSATEPPAPRAGVNLALGNAPGAATAPVSPAGGAQLTDAAGLAAWQVGVAPGTVTTLTLENPGAPAGTRSFTCLGADGVRTFGNGANLVIDGVPAGADLDCQLRLLDESKPLRVRMVPFPGDVTCPEDLAGLVALTAAPLGSPVTYCLEIVNEGKRTAVGVQVDVPGLDPAGPAWIVDTELAPAARARQRYVTTLQGPGPVGAVARAQGMTGDETGAYVGVLPPAATVEKLGPGDPACGPPEESPRGCYRVLNTGGSWLDQVSVVPTFAAVPLSIERRIAPGEAALLFPADDLEGHPAPPPPPPQPSPTTTPSPPTTTPADAGAGALGEASLAVAPGTDTTTTEVTAGPPGEEGQRLGDAQPTAEAAPAAEPGAEPTTGQGAAPLARPP